MNFLIHIISFLLLNCCFSVFYSSPLKPIVNIKYHLAISINPGANSSYVKLRYCGGKQWKFSVYQVYFTERVYSNCKRENNFLQQIKSEKIYLKIST